MGKKREQQSEYRREQPDEVCPPPVPGPRRRLL